VLGNSVIRRDSRQLSRSQIRIVLSRLLEARKRPSVEKATQEIELSWPRISPRSLPVLTSHSLTTRSLPPVASMRPSGEKAISLIAFSRPPEREGRRLRSSIPAAAFHNCSEPALLDAAARIVPSGESATRFSLGPSDCQSGSPERGFQRRIVPS